MYKFVITLILIICLNILTGCSPMDDSMDILNSIVETSIEALKVDSVTITPPPIEENKDVAQAEGGTTESSQPVLEITAENNLAGTPCDLAGPGRPLDLSIPDGHTLTQGQFFTKTWRVVNQGTCVWSENYSLVWFSGSEMGTTQSVSLDTEVNPGGYIDISVDLIAPEVPGIHQSNWKLRNEEGELFGIGPNGDYPIWVRVMILLTDTPTPEIMPAPTQIPIFVDIAEQKLSMQESFDLDSGEISTNLGADLQFRTIQDSLPTLLAINGSGFSVFGLEEPSLEQCRSLGNKTTSLSLEEIGEQYVCYQTNLGSYGYFLSSQIELADSSIRINYLCWQLP